MYFIYLLLIIFLYFLQQYSKSIHSSKIEKIIPTLEIKKNVVLGAQFKCPAKDGQYEDSIQCDKYYECTDGIPTPKLCPDGLVFDPTIRKRNKCDQPFNVECGDRTELRKYCYCYYSYI